MDFPYCFELELGWRCFFALEVTVSLVLASSPVVPALLFQLWLAPIFFWSSDFRFSVAWELVEKVD